MRDRLIDLLHDSDLSLDSVRLADHLIANGVVILDPQKYPPVTNRGIIDSIMGMPLDEMAELIRAKQEGRIIVPPVKAGQTVYIITDCSMIFMYHDNDYFTGTGAIECPFEDACNFTECNDENTQVLETAVHFLLCDDDGKWYFNCEHINQGYNFNDIGKSVFLTKEEAEKALAERMTKP